MVEQATTVTPNAQIVGDLHWHLKSGWLPLRDGRQVTWNYLRIWGLCESCEILIVGSR